MRAKWKGPLPSLAIPLLIGVAITVIVSRQVRQIAFSHDDNTQTFYSFARGLRDYEQMRPEWRTRILSNYLAGRLVNWVETRIHTTDRDHTMVYIPVYWTAAWLLFTYVLLIALWREKSLLYVFGIFAGISFAYTPGMGSTRIYPWDLTSLFAFACFVALLRLRRERWLVAFVPVAVLFKETSLLMVVAFLFCDDLPINRRIAFIVVTVMISLLLKGAVDLATANPSPIWTMTAVGGPDRVVRLGANVKQVLDLRANHPIFVDAGLLLALLVLPIENRQVLMLNIVAVLFTIGNLVFAVIIEYRIWFEAIPLALYGLDICQFGGGSPRRLLKAHPAEKEDATRDFMDGTAIPARLP